MFHLLHSLTLNLSYPSPLVSFMRPRLTGEINWECNFIFSGGLRETRLNEGKDEFHVRTFWFKFCSSSSVSSPLQKEYVHRAPHPGEERDGGGESESNHLLQQLLWRQKVSASCSVVLWIIQCVSKFMSTFSYLVYFSCLWCERSNHQSHFLQSQMLRRKQKSVLYVGMKTNWKLFILPPTSPESASHTGWTRCATRQGGKKKTSVRVFGYGNTKSYFRYHISDI